MRLRQIAFVAEVLTPAAAELEDVLGLAVCHRDAEVGKWGLENVVCPLGGDFVEIVAPFEAGTSAGRYLERRGGNGGYMVILQCDDAAAQRQRITALGVRAVWSTDRPNYRATHFHPADVGGVLLSVDSVTPGADYKARQCEWPPAGADWAEAVRTERVSALSGVELQGDDPAALAALWSRILDLPLEAGAGGGRRIQLENAEIRFVPVTDGRGPGISAIDVVAADRDGVLQAAAGRGLKQSDRQVRVCGTRVNLC